MREACRVCGSQVEQWVTVVWRGEDVHVCLPCAGRVRGALTAARHGAIAGLRRLVKRKAPGVFEVAAKAYDVYRTMGDISPRGDER